MNFIDNLDSYRHIALFYEEPEYAKIIECRFLLNGLKSGQTCIYLTYPKDNIDFVEAEMENNGISVLGYKQKNLLIIKQIGNIMSNPEELSRDFASFLDSAMYLKSPLFSRGVARFTSILDSEMPIRDILEMEHYLHNVSYRSQSSWLCHYRVESIEKYMDYRWTKEILDSHHAAIFAPVLSNGIAIYLQ